MSTTNTRTGLDLWALSEEVRTRHGFCFYLVKTMVRWRMVGVLMVETGWCCCRGVVCCRFFVFSIIRRD